MAVNETIVTGRKFRKLVDSANKSWQRISFWHKASDCEFDDGKTAQTKVGAISGITSDLSGESENVAASIKCVNSLNNSFGGMKFGVDSDGNYGYIKAGADTVTPFKSESTFECIYSKNNTSGAVNFSYTASKNNEYIMVVPFQKSDAYSIQVGGEVILNTDTSTWNTNWKAYNPITIVKLNEGQTLSVTCSYLLQVFRIY